MKIANSSGLKLSRLFYVYKNLRLFLHENGHSEKRMRRRLCTCA